jgi:membrane associated rhomboid family serine protease
VAFRPNWYESERRGRSAFGGAGSWSGFRWVFTLNCLVFALQIVEQMLVEQHVLPREGLLTRFGALRAYWIGPPTLAEPLGALGFNWLFPVQFVSYALLHDGLKHILLNMFALWVFSPELEAWMGRAAYLRLYILGAAFGGLLQWAWWLGTGSPGSVIGASGAVYAVMVLSALRWPHRTLLIWFILPVPVWLIAGLYVVGDLSSFLNSSAGHVAVLAHLGGAAFALVWHLKGDLLARAADARRRQVSVRQNTERDDDRREMDRILAKIQAHGLTSLDGSERAFLERRSREMRERGR